MDIYIVNTNNPKKLLEELQLKNPENNYVLLQATSSDEVLEEVNTLKIDAYKKKYNVILRILKDKFDEDVNIDTNLTHYCLENLLCKILENDRFRILVETSKDLVNENNYERATKKLNSIFDSLKYFEQAVSAPNCLSDFEIKRLCYEFYEKFVVKKSKNKYPNYPQVEIIKDIYWWFPSKNSSNGSMGYRKITDKYLKSIDEELKNYKMGGSLFHFVPYLSIYEFSVNPNNNFGGCIQHCRETERLFKINYNNVSLSQENKEFWNWYLKSFSVLALYYDKKKNTCYVYKKPDEWKFEENYTKMYYRYGKKEKFFIDKIIVPKRIYEKPANCVTYEELLLYHLIYETKSFLSFYIKDIEKLDFKGKSHILLNFNLVACSIQNKSFYKRFGKKIAKNYLLLVGKNSSSSIYTIEWVPPDCKNLEEALERRYSNKGIKDFIIYYDKNTNTYDGLVYNSYSEKNDKI